MHADHLDDESLVRLGRGVILNHRTGRGSWMELGARRSGLYERMEMEEEVFTFRGCGKFGVWLRMHLNWERSALGGDRIGLAGL